MQGQALGDHANYRLLSVIVCFFGLSYRIVSSTLEKGSYRIVSYRGAKINTPIVSYRIVISFPSAISYRIVSWHGKCNIVSYRIVACSETGFDTEWLWLWLSLALVSSTLGLWRWVVLNLALWLLLALGSLPLAGTGSGDPWLPSSPTRWLQSWLWRLLALAGYVATLGQAAR